MMGISWGNRDVRVYAAEAWISLAPRFAADHAQIVDQIAAILSDPAPAVRLQAAQNLQVICAAAPERMWAMAERLARNETDPKILTAYLWCSMRRFSHSDPNRCEAILAVVRERLDGDLARNGEGRDLVQESLGGWTAQLFTGQGRPLLRGWLKAWSADPQRYQALLNAYSSSLRGVLFHRYNPEAAEDARDMCDRAQAGLRIIVEPVVRISNDAFVVLTSDASEDDKKAARERYNAAERVLHHAINQLYFGARATARDKKESVGLPGREAMVRFMADYAELLMLLEQSREPATLHRLIELYESLIPGDPAAVFDVIHRILLGHGEAEGYHHESLANSAVVRIVRQYIADHRAIFEDDGRRAKLIQILQLFSEVGWTEALKLLYDLPDLLR